MTCSNYLVVSLPLFASACVGACACLCLFSCVWEQYCLEIYNPTGQKIKACKTENGGRVVEGKHQSYRMSATTAEERDDWIDSIRTCVTKDFFHDLVEVRKRKVINNNHTLVDWDMGHHGKLPSGASEIPCCSPSLKKVMKGQYCGVLFNSGTCIFAYFKHRGKLEWIECSLSFCQILMYLALPNSSQ